jgi:hypothetical protein
VDHNGEPAGSIEVIYLDNATGQPEWALLEAAAAAGRAPTFVPLVGASEEGDSVRVPFDKALVEGAPSVPADRELSEDEEGELYRHYGVPYSRDDSPSGLPAGAPETAGEPLPADGPWVAGGMASGEPLPAGEPEVAANEPLSASESLPAGVGAGGGALPEAAVAESAPISAGDVPPVPARVDAPAPDAPAAGDGLVARLRQLPITDPWVGAGAAAALAVAAGIWRRETVGRQVGMAVGRLAAIPKTVSRQRRRRRRAKAINQAVTGATQQTTALARAVARLLTGAALLPVTAAVQGSRRARASFQATRETTRRVGRRLRPSPRRRRRGGTFGMAVGGATGFVLGAKAGRQRYQEISETARRLMERPEVKRVTERAVARLDQVSSQAADWFQEARQSTGTEGSRSDGPRMTVVPDAPPVTSAQPTVGPTEDLAPMPPEPTVLPGERASSAERRRPAPPDPLP